MAARVSLVIPVLNEAENIPHMWSRLAATVSDLPYVFEVVFVDDGSTDETSALIVALPAAGNLEWRLVQLSRNFGHQAAISAGMAQSTGEAVIFLDADLQDPPELIATFLEKYRSGYDVVYGIRRNRKEPLWLRFCFAAFYRLFNSIADRPMPPDVGDFSLISRRVASILVEMPEYDRLIRGMRSWVGFRQVGVPYDRPGRYAGTTRYSLGRRVEGALDGLFGYSKTPIRMVFFLGMMVMMLGGAYLATALISAFCFGREGVPGWQSVITLAFMLGGANLIALAVVGEYVSRIYFQAKSRPLFVIQHESASRPSRPSETTAPKEAG